MRCERGTVLPGETMAANSSMIHGMYFMASVSRLKIRTSSKYEEIALK